VEPWWSSMAFHIHHGIGVTAQLLFTNVVLHLYHRDETAIESSIGATRDSSRLHSCHTFQFPGTSCSS
jgi:hypothetical protein